MKVFQISWNFILYRSCIWHSFVFWRFGLY